MASKRASDRCLHLDLNGLAQAFREGTQEEAGIKLCDELGKIKPLQDRIGALEPGGDEAYRGDTIWTEAAEKGGDWPDSPCLSRKSARVRGFPT